jgi:hypothetical protein
MTLLERSHDAHGYGVLGWLLAGADALSLCNADDRVLIARALESLPVPSTANHATIHRPLEPGVGVG